MWLWIVGGIVALAVVGVVVFAIFDHFQTAKIMRDGKPALCWVVMANDSLYKPMKEGALIKFSFAQLVFTLDPTVQDTHSTLAEWSERLRAFQPSDNPPEDERIIGSVMRTHVPYNRPLRLPDRLTGGAEGYTVTVEVYWDKLPEGILTLPYIYCQVLVGPGGGARMIEYPTGVASAHGAAQNR
jgi:hypothetical protein